IDFETNGRYCRRSEQLSLCQKRCGAFVLPIDGGKMEYTQLGRTGLKVSRLCLGTMNFGPKTTEADSFAIMDKALELGINFFDTANTYGWKLGEGWTEQILGRWFAQ